MPSPARRMGTMATLSSGMRYWIVFSSGVSTSTGMSEMSLIVT